MPHAYLLQPLSPELLVTRTFVCLHRQSRELCHPTSDLHLSYLHAASCISRMAENTKHRSLTLKRGIFRTVSLVPVSQPSVMSRSDCHARSVVNGYLTVFWCPLIRCTFSWKAGVRGPVLSVLHAEPRDSFPQWQSGQTCTAHLPARATISNDILFATPGTRSRLCVQ